MTDIYKMVCDFNNKFGLPQTKGPGWPEDEMVRLKLRHMEEELNEVRASYINGDLEGYFDGLIDLIYVALGAAYFSNLDFNEGFRRVHEANMTKVRAEKASDSKRGSTYDIVKPTGWVAPTLDDLVTRKEKE